MADIFNVITHYQDFDQWLRAQWGDLSKEDYNEVEHGHPLDGDYEAVTIERNGKVVAEYGDHYHDKGRDKSQGFTDAVTLLLPDAEIEYSFLADWK